MLSFVYAITVLRNENFNRSPVCVVWRRVRSGV